MAVIVIFEVKIAVKQFCRKVPAVPKDTGSSKSNHAARCSVSIRNKVAAGMSLRLTDKPVVRI